MLVDRYLKRLAALRANGVLSDRQFDALRTLHIDERQRLGIFGWLRQLTLPDAERIFLVTSLSLAAIVAALIYVFD